MPHANAELPAPLASLLSMCNGFYVFESALHVFPSAATSTERAVTEWNAPGVWRDAYLDLESSWWFFAEDIFGGQFALGDGVCTFDPETGAMSPIADDIEGWAGAVLDGYDVMTGFPLAHEWQVRNGSLRPGRRLVPKVPFVLGGEFSVDNLYDGDSVEAMRYRGQLASQIRDLPDGATVTLRIVN